MKRKILYIAIFFGIIMIMTSCERLGFRSTENTKLERNENSEENNSEKDLEFMVKNMSLREKVGQMVIAGIQGREVTEETKTFLEDMKIGGVILFSRNIENHKQLKEIISNLKDIDTDIDLFISVDEEGGRVSRLPEGKVIMPPNNIIAKQNDPKIFFDIAKIIGDELNYYGFNMDYAPVMDVWSNPQNQVIGNRSFSSNPHTVAECGINMINGFSEKGIISIIKHFPGHGDTLVDSHKGLPIIKSTLEELDERELIPFKAAIENGVDGVMVGHLLFSEIKDIRHPASLSKEIIQELLRDKMKYEGVVLSDDMEMGAILKNYNLKEASILGVEAGLDILLLCHNKENIKSVIEEIIKKVESDELEVERINESVMRILKLKKKYNIVDVEEWRDTYEKTNNN